MNAEKEKWSILRINNKWVIEWTKDILGEWMMNGECVNVHHG